MNSAFVKSALLAALMGAIALPVAAQEKEKKFGGLYVGGDAGVNDDGDFTYNAHLGARYQLDNGWVFGVEGKYGTVDVNGFDDFWSVTGQAGFSFGRDRKNLFYGGVGYTEFTALNVTFASEQYQLGYERSLTDNINFRLQSTWVPFDFGDVHTFTGGLSLKF